MKRRTYLGSLAAGMAGLGGCNGAVGNQSTTTDEAVEFRTETVTTDLEVPWGTAFDPDGVLYLTERPGRIRRVAPDGGDRAEVADLSDRVGHRGEGGLLGLAFHPDDPDLAYTYSTYEADGGLVNRVVRHRVGDDFAVEGVVLDDVPAGTNHDGGRLAFGPDGALYVTTGDAGRGERAQNPDSLAGKVLRLTPDGDPHPDNPGVGDPRVFTYGHRNPQGWRGATGFSSPPNTAPPPTTR